MIKNYFAEHENEKPKRVNISEHQLNRKPLSAEEIQDDENRTLTLVHDEFKLAFEFLRRFPKSVSIFGSTRLPETDSHYHEARSLAAKISKKGYAVLTGGGPGIMEAANRGARENGGMSLGLGIRLPKEQVLNPYVEAHVDFYYFFTRKTALAFAAEAYIFFPGGFGTLDEFFDILTLVQTRKIPRVPIILVGRDYWKPMDEFVRTVVCERHKAVNPEEMKLYEILDNHEEILSKIEQNPVQAWWRNFELND